MQNSVRPILKNLHLAKHN